MINYRTIYVPQQPHQHEFPDLPVGSILRCEKCKNHFWAVDTDGAVPSTTTWKMVRWWNVQQMLIIMGFVP